MKCYARFGWEIFEKIFDQNSIAKLQFLTSSIGKVVNKYLITYVLILRSFLEGAVGIEQAMESLEGLNNMRYR